MAVARVMLVHLLLLLFKLLHVLTNRHRLSHSCHRHVEPVVAVRSVQYRMPA